MNNLKKIIKTFKEKCDDWTKEYTDYSIIFNKDLNNLKENEIKYILIGDNPGNIEADKKRYLVGPAGISARVFFERYLVDNFNKEVLVLNKTPIYTNVTDGLKKVDILILQKTQKYIVSIINDLYKLLKKPVIISGFAGCHKSKGGFIDKTSKDKNAVGKFFFSELKNVDFGKGNKDLFIIKHFSRMSIFDDFTIETYEKYLENNNFNILETLGAKYRNEFFLNINSK